MTGNGHRCNCTMSGVAWAVKTIAVDRGRRVRDGEKRGRRSSLRILLHFIDGAGLEEGGTRDRCPERDGCVGVGRAMRTIPLNTGS